MKSSVASHSLSTYPPILFLQPNVVDEDFAISKYPRSVLLEICFCLNYSSGNTRLCPKYSL